MLGTFNAQRIAREAFCVPGVLSERSVWQSRRGGQPAMAASKVCVCLWRMRGVFIRSVLYARCVLQSVRGANPRWRLVSVQGCACGSVLCHNTVCPIDPFET